MGQEQLAAHITELWISKAVAHGTAEGLAKSACDLVNSAVADFTRSSTPMDSLVIRVLREPPVNKIDLAIAGLQHLKQFMRTATATATESRSDDGAGMPAEDAARLLAKA